MTTETIETNEVESTEVDVVQALTVFPENTTALSVFKNEHNEAEIILSRVKEHFSSLVFDMDTAKGRAECRAQAALIRKIKAKMEEIGKAEAAELKLLPKKIDATRNLFKTALEDLAIAVREPLTAYEAEEERKKAEKEAAKKAEQLAKQMELDHREALLMNAEFDAERARIKAQAEQEQKEREEQLKREAEEKAKYQADLAIQQAKNAELEAIRAKETAEKEKAEALAKAEKAKQAEIAQIKAENEAKEKARLDAEAKEKAEEEARKADIEHQRTINREAIACLMELDLEQATAEKILIAIVRGEIAHVSINY